MAEFPLAESRSVTLVGGTGTVIGIGPVRYGEVWNVKLISVNTPNKCRFYVYRGRDTSPQYQIDATARGDLDTSPTDVTLMAGDSLSFKWTNGTSGDVGTVRIEGTRTLKGY